MSSVQLRLPRARTREEIDALPSNVLSGTPDECKGAAVALFLLDAVEHPGDGVLLDKLKRLVLSTDKACQQKVSGGQHCSLRVAGFSTWLACSHPQNRVDDEALAWAARVGLRGFIRDPPWRLSDLMLALECLSVRYESVTEQVWGDGKASDAFCSDASLYGRYLSFLWGQCAHFLRMQKSSHVVKFMDSNSFTIPYPTETGGHRASLSPDALCVMCELWRFVESEKSTRFSNHALCAYQKPARGTAVFDEIFYAERAQLDVDTFREKLRLSLVRAYSCPTDAEVWSFMNGGKEPEEDLVMSAMSPLAMPAFVQKIASTWTFEQMVQCSTVRDCLHMLMVDSAFLAKFHVRWSPLFLQPSELVSHAPKLKVPCVRRLCGKFVVVVKRKAVTPPISFAECFHEWARRMHIGGASAYGSDFTPVTALFAG